MRALRRIKHEPGLAEERRNLVHRYMGDETPAPESATEELPTGELVEEVVVSLPLTVATDVVANDVEQPPVSSPAPRGVVGGETPALSATEGLRDDEAVEDVSPRSTAVTHTVANDVEPPPAPPIAATDLLETLRREVDTRRAAAPEPPPAPPIAAPDPLETLQPSTFGAALRTLEEVGRLCEQLVRLGEEYGRWNALLAEQERQLVPPPGSAGS